MVGGPGSGKSTVAATLAERIGAQHVDGNYIDEIADLVWPAADAVVWLDPPRHIGIRIGHALTQHGVADTKVVRLSSDAAVARWLGQSVRLVLYTAASTRT